MRFKRLKLAVGIALAIFVLVVGNIILIGEASKGKQISQDQNMNTTTDSRKLILGENVVIPAKTVTPSQITTENNDPSNNPTVSAPVDPAPTPTVVHSSRKTRAS